jgi:hypothetical protein
MRIFDVGITNRFYTAKRYLSSIDWSRVTCYMECGKVFYSREEAENQLTQDSLSVIRDLSLNAEGLEIKGLG